MNHAKNDFKNLDKGTFRIYITTKKQVNKTLLLISERDSVDDIYIYIYTENIYYSYQNSRAMLNGMPIHMISGVRTPVRYAGNAYAARANMCTNLRRGALVRMRDKCQNGYKLKVRM